MKKWILGIAAFTGLCVFMGAGMIIEKDYRAEIVKGAYISPLFLESENFSVVLKSRSELDRYVDKILQEYLRDSAVIGDYRKQLVTDVKAFYGKWDEAFFEVNDLVIALVNRGSGSVRYEVRDIRQADGELVVTVREEVPMIVTCDYVAWVLFLEIDNEVYDVNKTRVELVK